MKCQACEREIELPFRCSYCGGGFCSDHRLPENHACPRIEQARVERQGQVMQQQAYGNYSYSYMYGQPPHKKQFHIRWSPTEIKHVGIAATLVLGIGYSMYLYYFGFNLWSQVATSFFAIFMMMSFLTHEIAHKVMAQKAGLWAEFRLTTWGALLTAVSVFLPFKMIAPGAMMISGQISNAKDMIKISIAGVIANLILAVTFLSIAIAVPMDIAFFVAFAFLAYINAFMALFNLIPFGILDGYKIFSLNKKIWAAAFISSLLLVILTMIVFPFFAWW